MKDKPECILAEGFNIWQKIYAQFSFISMGIIGTVGIALVDWRWALLYLFLYLYGIMGVVMRHLVCPRCPHLHVYNDCLQAPPKLTMWLVKKRKTTPLSVFEKFLFYAYFILVPIFPIYWLLSNPILLGVFLIPASMWYLGQFLYFCRMCRVFECPFNRATSKHK